MGGTSTSQSSSTGSSSPWAAAMPAVNGLLGQVSSNLNNTSLTPTETGAINQLETNAPSASQFAPQINSYAGNLLNGGGATAQSPALQNGLSTLQGQLTPYANGSMIGNNPALQAQLQGIQSDVTNNVNGTFAAAGRDGSGMNQQTLARGIAQGEAPVIAGQYNQDVANQMNAANSLYGAQNSTSGLLSGLTQQGLANQGQGVTAAGQATDAMNAGANQTLQAEAARRGIPVQALGLLAQIGVPLAGLGQQTSGTQSGSQTMSGAQQFATIAGGIGSMIPKFGSGNTFNF